MTAAQNEARAAGHGHISPAHLALGLLGQSGSLAEQAITAQGPSVEAVRQAVTRQLPPRGEGETPALIPFDPQAKKALELTFREALRLGHNYVGTEHLLLALLELEDGNGPLTGAGLDKAGCEQWISATLSILSAPGPPG